MATNLDLSIPFSGQILSNAQWQQMAAAYRGDGVLQSLGSTPLQVAQHAAGADMSVDVAAGRIAIQGTHGENSSVKNLAIASNSSGNPRIDVVVARLVQATPNIVLDILQGTPAGSPSPVALSQNASIWESALAQIAVASGAASIVTANITDRRSLSSHGGGVLWYSLAAATTINIYFTNDPIDMIVNITGTGTTTTAISVGPAGTRLTLRFSSAGCTISNTGTLKLASDYLSTVNGCLNLVSDGTNWYEVSRNPPLLTVAANLVAAGPASGGAAQATYRALVAADGPAYAAGTALAATAFAQGVSNPSFSAYSNRFVLWGKRLHWQFGVTFSSVGSAGSEIIATIPAAYTLPAAAASGLCIGNFIYYDAGTRYVGNIESVTTTTMRLIVHNAAAGIGSVPNFAVANNDQLYCNINTEIA